MSLIVFDLMGTVVDLRPLGRRLTDAGAPETALEAWFERTLHHAACVTLAGEFAPFADLARAALETTLVSAGVDPSSAGDIMQPLASGSLPAYPEAATALRGVRAAGGSVGVLTNGSAEQTEMQLRSADLEALVDHVWSVEEASAYKPHPSAYGLVGKLAEGRPPVLVAAHAWDVFGARAAGWDAVWVRRAPAPWPFPGEASPTAADLETAVGIALANT